MIDIKTDQLNKYISALLNKSEEAYLMSIEIINKPTINYRTEGFCFFICNAWELLLKAYLINKAKDINLIKVNIVAIDITIEKAIELETKLIDKYKRISDGGSLVNVDYKRGGGLRKSLEKKVYQFTIWGDFIAEYKSIAEASRLLGLNAANIGNCCNNIKGHNTCSSHPT